MAQENIKPTAARIAELTFRLLSKCQEKEVLFAQKYGISLAHFRCLRHLHEHQQATVKQLAEYMALTSSRLTRIIDELVERDIVTREEGMSDRRIFIIKLTPKGKPFAEELYVNFSKLHEKMFSSIPVSEQRDITQSLEKILETLEIWLKEDDVKKWEFLQNNLH